MKIPHPYKCDGCNALKGDANSWYLRIPDGVVFTVLPWNPLLADDEATKAEHLCGRECLNKSLDRWLQSHGKPAPEALAHQEAG